MGRGVESSMSRLRVGKQSCRAALIRVPARIQYRMELHGILPNVEDGG